MPGENQLPQRVVVVNIDIPFGTIIKILVTWALAAIPALALLAAIGALFSIIVVSCVSGMVHH